MAGIDFLKNSKWGTLWSDCSPSTLVIDFRDDTFYILINPPPIRDHPYRILAVDDKEPVFILTVHEEGSPYPQPTVKITIVKHDKNQITIVFPKQNIYLQRCNRAVPVAPLIDHNEGQSTKTRGGRR